MEGVNLFLNDNIKGHPLASDGWFKEALGELEDMGVIIN